MLITKTKAILGAQQDGERQKEGDEPGQSDDLVIPRKVADNETAADEASGDKDGGDDEGRKSASKDLGTAIWDVATGHGGVEAAHGQSWGENGDLGQAGC